MRGVRFRRYAGRFRVAPVTQSAGSLACWPRNIVQLGAVLLDVTQAVQLEFGKGHFTPREPAQPLRLLRLTGLIAVRHPLAAEVQVAIQLVARVDTCRVSPSSHLDDEVEGRRRLAFLGAGQKSRSSQKSVW